jgi:hypothetical protein
VQADFATVEERLGEPTVVFGAEQDVLARAAQVGVDQQGPPAELRECDRKLRRQL